VGTGSRLGLPIHRGEYVEKSRAGGIYPKDIPGRRNSRMQGIYAGNFVRDEKRDAAVSVPVTCIQNLSCGIFLVLVTVDFLGFCAIFF
jgi:hypothetical protein